MMNRINDNQLRTDQEMDYYSRIVQLIEVCNTEALQIKQFSDSFISVFHTALNASQENSGNEFTESFNELEKLRDNSFIAFRDSVKANTYSVNPNIADKARALELVIIKHGWSMHLKGNKLQTAVMNNLIAELDSADNKSCIEALNLYDLYKDMCYINTDFITIDAARITIEPDNENSDRLEIYKEVRQCCHILFSSIDLFYKFNGNRGLLDIASRINAITNEYNLIALSQEGKSKSTAISLEQRN